MRVSFLTLCTLTAWTLQNYDATTQAQVPPDVMPEGTVSSAANGESVVVTVTTVTPELTPPETADFVQFSPNATASDFPDPEPAAETEFFQAASQNLERRDPSTVSAAELRSPSIALSPAEEYTQSVEQVLQVISESSSNPSTTRSDSSATNDTGWNSTDVDCEEHEVEDFDPNSQTASLSALAATPPPPSPLADFNTDSSPTPESTAACVAQVEILITPPVTEVAPIDVPPVHIDPAHIAPVHIAPTVVDAIVVEEAVPAPLYQLPHGVPPGVPIYRVPEDPHIHELLHESEAEFIGSQAQGLDGPTVSIADNITDAGLDIDNDWSPLEQPPTRLFNLETANQLSDNALQISAGFHQTLSNDSPAPATGGQLYYGTLDWGITDDLQLGLAGQYFDDPLPSAIDGEFPNITLYSVAPSVKYQFFDQPEFDLGIQGSVELFSVDSSLFDTDGDDAQVIGSFHVPMSYAVGSDVQLHLTPGVSFFPDSINDNDFYGTVFSVGTGVSWQPSERLLFYSTLNVPLGPGGNAISSDDQDIENQLVWTVGSRYNVTPKVGVDLYATNGLGVTPATGILSFMPEGDDPLLGLKLTYTPDLGLGYRSSFRDGPAEDLSERDYQLLLDGFTLSTPHTVQPGSILISAGGGTNDRFYTSAAYSPDEDLQIEGVIEEFSNDDALISENTAGDNVKYAVGAQLRLLNQQQGDPFSLGARLIGGRDTDSDRQIGTLFADLPMSYDVSDRTTLSANPRLAAFSDDEVFGLGFGINHEVLDGLQLIGEVTPVIDETVVWAAGARYAVPKTGISLDLYASNAAGRNGLGTLVGEADTSVGFNFNWLVGDR